MNSPVRSYLDQLLVKIGSDSTILGSGSIGLIAAAFSPGPNLKLSDIVEATFSGYVRKPVGTPTITFTGADGNEYVEGTTAQWIPTDTVTVNTIYGVFFTPGSDTTKLQMSDPLPTPVGMSSPANSITITPRFGLNPANGFGINVISN